MTTIEGLEYKHDCKIDDKYISADVLAEDETEPTNIGSDPHLSDIQVNQKVKIPVDVMFADQDPSISMFERSHKKKSKERGKRSIDAKRASQLSKELNATPK